MKLHNLSITNIHSISGTQSIDFDEISKSSDGVFLITGPTGSGKTTILDSITLALFGQVSRYKEKITDTHLNKHRSVMTIGTMQSKSELTFSINGKTYIAIWEVAIRKRVGGINKPEHQLIGPDRTVIASGVNNVQKEVELLLGMNFEQFTKSILLAQGDFASFLKASFSEKAAILEKITGTEIYSKLSTLVYEYHKSLQQQLKSLEDQRQMLNIMPDEAYEAIQSEQAELMTQKSIAESKRKELTGLLQQIQVFNDTTKKKNDLASQKQILNLEINSTEALHLNSFEKLDVALQCRSEIDQIQRLENEISDISNTLHLAHTQSKQTDQELIALKKSVARYVSEDDTTDEIILKLEAILSKVEYLDKEIDKLDISIKTAEKSLNNFKELKISQDKLEEQLPLLQGRKSTLENDTIELVKSLSGLTPTQESIDEIDQKLLLWQKIDEKIIRYKQNQTKIRTAKIEIEDLANKVNLATKDLSEAKTVLTLAEENLNNKSIIKSQNDKIKSFESHRHDLKAGEACPLCGALDGPFRHQSSDTDDQIDRDFKEAEKNVKEVTQRVNELDKELTTVQVKYANADDVYKKIDSEQAVLKQEIIINKETLQFEDSLFDNDQIVSHKISQLSSQKMAVKQILLKSDELISINGAMPIIQDIIKHSEELKKLTVEKKNHYHESEPAVEFFNRFQKKYNQLSIQNTKTQTIISTNTSLLENHKIRHAEYADQLTQKLTGKGIVDKKEVITLIESSATIEKIRNDLNEKKQNLIKIQSQIELLDLQINDLKLPDTDQKELEMDLSELDQKLSMSTMQLGRIEEQIANHLKNLDKADELTAQIKTFEKNLISAGRLNELIGSADGQKFRRLAQKVTLSQLVLFANKYLERMSGRYQFYLQADEIWSDAREMDLFIIDAYESDVPRSTATLSGGETFIASLALALGLSDYASNNNKIESLFIDEGFGTLDADTLDVALSALENIQQDGNKTLCLITHVAAMKERIPYHLRVSRRSHGHSTIQYEINY